MGRSEADAPAVRRRPIDWQGWLVVAWVAVFGTLYVRMMAESRAATIARALQPLATLARSARIIR